MSYLRFGKIYCSQAVCTYVSFLGAVFNGLELENNKRIHQQHI